MRKLAVAFAFIVIFSMFAYLMISSEESQILLRKSLSKTHETYSPDEPNYQYCMDLCIKKGGVNCGGKRKGCCQSDSCHINKIYGYGECETGKSVVMGTTYCIGSWGQ